MASRDPEDLLPELANRWEQTKSAFTSKHPTLAQPFLTQTYRSPEEQNELYEQGRSKPGKVVTNAKGGQSLHNYQPALALDIAFKSADGEVHWDLDLFSKFAEIGKNFGLAWGGDWMKFKDYPHYQPPNYTWQMAQQGIAPTFPVV